MIKTKIVMVACLLAASGAITAEAEPQWDLRALIECETQRALDEQLYGADNVDSDGDGLSNELETSFLGTEACLADSDGDNVPDGTDALPLAADDLPLDITVVAINQVAESSACDPDSLWDPFVSVFHVEVTELGLGTPNLGFIGWAEAAHIGNRLNQNSDIAFSTIQGGGGAYAASGNTLTLQLDPDINMWGSGIVPSLTLDVGIMVIDNDKKRDDIMKFNPDAMVKDILSTATKGLRLKSDLAYDSNTASIPCQAEFYLETKLVGLTEEVMRAATGLLGGLTGLDDLLQCADEHMANCLRGSDTHSEIDLPSLVAPGLPGTAEDPCDDAIIWDWNGLLMYEAVEVWSPECAEDQQEN